MLALGKQSQTIRNRITDRHTMKPNTFENNFSVETSFECLSLSLGEKSSPSRVQQVVPNCECPCIQSKKVPLEFGIRERAVPGH
ncbi:hypothetical protein CDAR_216491 [Caerostris darwini]|uniref:Uncharacterized protein n=1 Tax=Caerostris darwini TaxID=1538125 RepID=A0AAV4W9B7_9ARAC|nr:hypothetical protein CDAR_216491 [Caerostris darwini]